MPDIEIEAFRTGTPAARGITSAQLAEAVSGYDPERNPAPVVMGHPNDDHSAPAFGAIAGARIDGDRLFVKIKNLAQEAIDGVRQSRILNRSIAFWHPNHPANPTPGKLALRHLGLLGGALPGVPNMAPLRFSADDGAVIADGDPADAVIYAAPAAPAEIDVADLAAKVAAIINPEPRGKEFSVTDEELKAREEQLAAREQVLADRETAFAASEKARADADRKAREDDNAAFAAKLVAEGRFPAGHKDDLAAILNALPTDTLVFSGEVTEAPATALRRILSGAQQAITFAAITPGGMPPASGPAADAEQAALAAANAKMAERWKA